MSHQPTRIDDADTTPIAIATVLQVQAPTSAKPGDKAMVGQNGVLHGWVGGGCVQPAVIKIAKEVLDSGQPCMLRVAPDGQWQPVDGLTDYASSCLGRGSLLLFVEPLRTQPTLCVFGHSAVAISLATQALNVKLNVILQAPNIKVNQLSQAIDLRQQFETVSADFIVIATQGNGDKSAIATALTCDCEHINMVVSERKLDALKQVLIEDGFDKNALARLNGQAGLRIGAQLPEEIALSVLAQIVQLRRKNTENIVHGGDISSISEKKPVSSDIIKQTQNDGSCCGG